MKKMVLFACLAAAPSLGDFAPSAFCKPALLAQAESPKIFHGIGKVTAIDATSGLVSLDHEDIPGLMDAMEMQYEAKPARLLEGLAIGDKVEFSVDGKTLVIVQIRKR